MKFANKKFVIILLVISACILFLGSLRIGHELWYKEEYCERIAKEQVGDGWSTNIDANDYEKSHYPQIVQDNGKIFLGMHKVLDCGRNYKFLNF